MVSPARADLATMLRTGLSLAVAAAGFLRDRREGKALLEQPGIA